MKALVTGGTGFIGSHLIEKLTEKNFDVRCIAKDRLNATQLETMNIDIVLGDINNGLPWEMLLQDVDYVFHLAGVTRAKVTQDYYEGNYAATKRFVDMVSKYSPRLKRFIYISSLSAVGPRTNGEEVTETTPYHPISHYGKSKMLAELEVLRTRDKMPITVVRPSAVYGPRDRDMFQYFKVVNSGIEPFIGFGKKYLNLVHVHDLVDGIVLAALQPGGENEIMFLGSEINYSTRDVCESIATALHRKAIRITLPHALVYAVGAVAGAVGKITNRQTLFNIQKAREATCKAWTCSVEKAVNRIGYHQNISLDDGMKSTYHWYKENGWM